MKYYFLPEAGVGPILGERDVPEPGPGEVLVRMRGWSVNFRDLMLAGGRYPKPVKPDVIALSDGAGDVVALGADRSEEHRLNSSHYGLSRMPSSA